MFNMCIMSENKNLSPDKTQILTNNQNKDSQFDIIETQIKTQIWNALDSSSLDFTIDEEFLNEQIKQANTTSNLHKPNIASTISNLTPIDSVFIYDQIQKINEYEKSITTNLSPEEKEKRKLLEQKREREKFFQTFPFYEERKITLQNKNISKNWKFFSKESVELANYMVEFLSNQWLKKYLWKIWILFWTVQNNYDSYAWDFVSNDWKLLKIPYQYNPSYYWYEAAIDITWDDEFERKIKIPWILNIPLDKPVILPWKIFSNIFPIHDEIVNKIALEIEAFKWLEICIPFLKDCKWNFYSHIHDPISNFEVSLKYLEQSIVHFKMTQELYFLNKIEKVKSSKSFTNLDILEIDIIRTYCNKINLLPIKNWNSIFGNLSENWMIFLGEAVMYILHDALMKNFPKVSPIEILKNPENYKVENQKFSKNIVEHLFFQIIINLSLEFDKSPYQLNIKGFEEVSKWYKKIKNFFTKRDLQWVSKQEIDEIFSFIDEKLLEDLESLNNKILKDFYDKNSTIKKQLLWDKFLDFKSNISYERSKNKKLITNWKINFIFYETKLTKSDWIVLCEENDDFWNKKVWLMRYPNRIFKEFYEKKITKI